MNKLAILVFLLVLRLATYAQQGTSISIYFHSNSDVASTTELAQLHAMLKDRDCGLCSINMNGHTDSDGSDDYNQKLSERRIAGIKTVLSKSYGCFKVREEQAYGELKPINENKNAVQKAKNRRVEIQLICSEKPEETKEEPKEKPVWGDYKGLLWSAFIDCGTKDMGYMDAHDGIKLIIDPNTYGDEDKQLRIQLYTSTTRQTAFNHRFTTQTATKLLESAGMFKVVATENGKEIQPVKKDGIHVFIPMLESQKHGFTAFNAIKNDNYTIWEEIKTNNTHSFYDPRQTIADLMDGEISQVRKCTFFWCKIKSFFSKNYRARRSQTLANMVGQNQDVMRVYDLFEKQLKSKFPSKEAFTAFILANDRETVLNELGDQIQGFDDISYYVLDLPNSNWINCDWFTNFPNLINVEVDEKYSDDADIRLFFDKQLSIMRASSNDKKNITFNNVPVGELVTLIIVKKLGEILYLSKESFKIGETPRVSFRIIDTNELKNIFSEH